MEIKGRLLLENVDENKEQWLKIKTTSIGSSEIAVLMGGSPFQTVNDLYKAKQTGKSEIVENDAMWWGTALEKIIFERFLQKTSLKGKQPFKMYCDEAFDWATCSPDGFLFDPLGEAGSQYGLAEIKNVSAYKIDEWAVEPPRYYWMQVQWQLGIMGQPWAFLVAKIDHELVMHKIFFDEGWYQEALNAAADFLEAVKTNTTFSARFDPRPRPKETAQLTLSSEESKHLEDYLSLKERIKAIEAQAKPLEKEKKELEEAFASLAPSGGELVSFDNSAKLKISISPVNVKAYSYEKRTFTANRAK
jgi:putative phage-type endonuclease